MKVNIKHFEETKVAVIEHRAAPELVNESASQFIQWRKNDRALLFLPVEHLASFTMTQQPRLLKIFDSIFVEK